MTPLRKRYPRFALGLCCLGGFVVVMTAVVGWMLLPLETDADAVALVGQQKMLAQRIPMLALRLQQETSPSRAANFNRYLLVALETLKGNQAQLQASLTTHVHTPLMRGQVSHQFAAPGGLNDTLKDFWVFYRQQWQRYNQLKTSAELSAAALKPVVLPFSQQEALLGKLDQVALLLDTDQQLYRREIQTVLVVFLIGGLLLGFLEWFLLFKPLLLQAMRENDELKHMRRTAEEETQAKSDLLATVSHEIRTPLNGIMGMAEILRESNLALEQREQAQTIHRSANALLNLLNEVLDFSRLEAKRMTLEHIPIDLHALLEEVVDLFAQQALHKPVELVIDLSPACPSHIMGDPVRLKQVLWNLVANAFKFTSRGHVSLRVSISETASLNNKHTDPVLNFVVEDTGKGIAPQEQAHLFDKFRQEDASTARRFGGSGLGLNICKQLVTLMQGTIGVASTPGQGTRFWFDLPLHDSPIQTMDEWYQAEPPTLANSRLWLVESNPAARAAVALWLSHWGVEFTILDSVNSLQPFLPGESPSERPWILASLPSDEILVEAWLVACLPWSSTTVLASQHQALPIEELIQQGYSGVIRKPVLPGQLFRVLTALAEVSPGGSHPFYYRHGWVPRQTEPTLPVITVEPSVNSRTTPSPRPTARTLASNPLAQPAVLTPDTTDAPRGHVLVVEDNLNNQHVMRQFLKKLNYTLDIAENGETAVALSQAHTYNAILMDCELPDMDGFEVTYRIRARELSAGQHIPIIALTAHRELITRTACIAKGMDDHLTKPLALDVLKTTLERWIPAPVST